MEVAVFGERVKAFLQTDVGKYIIELAADERDVALQTLRTVDPRDPMAVAMAQMRVKLFETFEQWLSQAIVAGLQAEKAMER